MVVKGPCGSSHEPTVLIWRTERAPMCRREPSTWHTPQCAPGTEGPLGHLVCPFAQWVIPGRTRLQAGEPRLCAPVLASLWKGWGGSVYSLFCNADMKFGDSLWGALPFGAFYW